MDCSRRTNKKKLINKLSSTVSDCWEMPKANCRWTVQVPLAWNNFFNCSWSCTRGLRWPGRRPLSREAIPHRVKSCFTGKNCSMQHNGKESTEWAKVKILLWPMTGPFFLPQDVALDLMYPWRVAVAMAANGEVEPPTAGPITVPSRGLTMQKVAKGK